MAIAILMQNYPSGDPAPSQVNHRMSRQLVEAANLLRIQRLDHVIVGIPEEGRSPYFSLSEAGGL